ncbi:hypothetical protein J7E87_23340 [Streptomyces sp. ISL-1]|uniref:hypothetical protein n=1 Tax=Streptomyces sp. ISL-1 TaxID=2817657 RepID=UPI001BEB94EC|nr:hypothetical protein [Streptomyces sp. ISL-1]MBT2392275.1 hypothetical protein [Streptomyces sp. ISL-1]
MTTDHEPRSHRATPVTRVSSSDSYNSVAHCDVAPRPAYGPAAYNAGREVQLDALRLVRGVVDSGPCDVVAPWLAPTRPTST